MLLLEPLSHKKLTLFSLAQDMSDSRDRGRRSDVDSRDRGGEREERKRPWRSEGGDRDGREDRGFKVVVYLQVFAEISNTESVYGLVIFFVMPFSSCLCDITYSDVFKISNYAISGYLLTSPGPRSAI